MVYLDYLEDPERMESPVGMVRQAQEVFKEYLVHLAVELDLVDHQVQRDQEVIQDQWDLKVMMEDQVKGDLQDRWVNKEDLAYPEIQELKDDLVKKAKRENLAMMGLQE